jgi:cell wall-associated NlpC family hydrolase
MKYILMLIALGFLIDYQFNSGPSQPDLQEEKSTLHQVTSDQASVGPKAIPIPTPQKKRAYRISRHELVDFAKLFYGVPYKYGSTDPDEGFDCSGYINHVYTHFGIEVPRSSVDFTNAGTTVQVEDAVPGDLILFTGTDPETRVVGHIGIIIKNDDDGLEFIHSSSGKAASVTINPLEGYYENRFVKVIRLV